MGDWKPRLSPYRPAALDRCGRFYRRRGPLSIYKNRLPSSTTLIHALFPLVHPARLGAPAPSSFAPTNLRQIGLGCVALAPQGKASHGRLKKIVS